MAGSDRRTYALALIGVDRPGIVAAVAGGLSELGCSLEDVATSLLRGHFALVLEFTAPAGAGQVERIRAHLLERTSALEVHLDVWPVAPSEPEGGATHVLRLHGPDQVGIVAAIAEVLSRRGVSIREMSCSRDGGSYVVVVEIEVPRTGDDLALERELRGVAERLTLRLGMERIHQEAF